MQDTTSTVTSTTASNASGTINSQKTSRPRRLAKPSKTKSTDVFTITSKGEVQTTNTILGAAKIVKNFRAAGHLPTEISVNKNGRVLGWASFASMVSVKRRQNALANASKPKTKAKVAQPAAEQA